MNLQIETRILFKNEKGEYLFLKKDQDKHPECNYPWASIGGEINPEKDLMYNLRREISEEIGLYVGSSFALKSAQDIIENDKHIVRLTYVTDATFSNQEITLGSDYSEFAWLSMIEIAGKEDIDRYTKEVVGI